MNEIENKTVMHARFGQMFGYTTVRNRLFTRGQRIKHRATGEIRTAYFFFHYGDNVGVCWTHPDSYDLRKPLGEQEGLLFEWVPHHEEPQA